VFLIFASGKLVCVGGKSEDLVHEAFEKMGKIFRDENLLVL